jgi:hypothetical protein
MRNASHIPIPPHRLTVTAILAVALMFGFGLARGTATASDDPSDISAAAARNRIEDLKVGDELDAKGVVLDNKDEISAGKTVYASFRLDDDDVAAGTPVKVIWRGPGDTRYYSTTQNVIAGTRYMVFTSPDTANWMPGEYHVDVRLGDELAASEDFDLEEAVVE